LGACDWPAELWPGGTAAREALPVVPPAPAARFADPVSRVRAGPVTVPLPDPAGRLVPPAASLLAERPLSGEAAPELWLPLTLAWVTSRLLLKPAAACRSSPLTRVPQPAEASSTSTRTGVRTDRDAMVIAPSRVDPAGKPPPSAARTTAPILPDPQ
jgi:hypothetical protein